MTETQKEFIERVTYLELRYKKDKYVTSFLMPRELLVRLKDEMEIPDISLKETGINLDAYKSLE
jgi:hypothetical protein